MTRSRWRALPRSAAAPEGVGAGAGLEAEGRTVEVAFDGDDGLWLATESIYDLLVLDIMLPGRNGYRICADLRAAGNRTRS